MALARIVTRSHQYAQQLALDLLVRGYTVEMVRPEAIPATPADLELRVEGGGGEVQGLMDVPEQGRTAKSIQYLQRLKPMMADLLRKWPARADVRQASSEKGAEFNFNAEAEYSDVELPSGNYERHREPELTSPELTSEVPDFVDSARLIAPTPPQKASSPASSIFSITGEPISWAESEPERDGRSEVWFWRAAVGFACMALVILMLGMALRKSPSAAAHVSPPAATQTVAAATQLLPATPTPATPTPKPSASVAPLPEKADVVPTVAPTMVVAKAKPAAAVRRTRAGQNNEVVNGDTTITYFKGKAAEAAKPATANQGAGIRHYSDLD